MTNFQTARVLENINPSGTFHVVKFEYLEPGEFNFHPGQFIAVQIDNKQIKNYSMSTLPNGKLFETIANIGVGGSGSYFIDQLREGDEIRFMGPLGNFIYHPEDSAEKILHFANGAGIGTIKAIMEDAIWHHQDQRIHHLYYSLLEDAEDFLIEYFNEMQEKYSNFNYQTGSTKENIQAIQKKILDSSQIAAYLCGGADAIKQISLQLKSAGISPSCLYHEAHFAKE